MTTSRRLRSSRILAGAVVLALVVAACGGDDDDAEPTADAPDTADGSDTGAGTSGGDGGGIQTDGFESLGEVTLTVLAEENDELTLERAIALFEERYPNVTVDVTLRAFDDYMQIAPGILQSDDPPDVAHGNQGYTIDGLLVQGGLILPLDDYAEVYGWNEAFGHGSLDQYRFDETGTNFGEGILWGVSGVAEVVGVFYNKEKLTAIDGELPATFEEFESLLVAAAEVGEVPIQLGNAEGWPALHVYGLVQAAFRPAPEIRAWTFGVPGSTVETPEELEAVERLLAWNKAGYFPEGVNGIGWDDGVARFIDGEGVFLIGGNWNAHDLETGMGDNVGYFAMPVGPSGVIGGTGSMALPWHITSKAEHPDLAAAFIQTMMAPEFAAEFAALGRVPAQQVDIELSGLIADTAAGAAAMIADDGLTLYADWTTDTMFNTLTAKTQELLGGRIDAAQYLAAVQADWEAFFAD